MKIVLASLLVSFASAIAPESLHKYNFDLFLSEYKKEYADKKEYELRKTLFNTRVKEFIQHNNDPSTTYTLNVNKFADLSDSEITSFLGYNKHAQRPLASGQSHPKPTSIADSLDWREKGAITPVKDQAACGSCWAFGSAETLESHTYIHGGGNLPILSPQQFVDCAPNPNHCGGTGGCEGSIPELAYKWATGNGGLSSEKAYPYVGRDEKCKSGPAPVANVTGYVNVASNNYTAVMEALQYGPLAITVTANPWMFYAGGIFNMCSIDYGLDHVVQLVGYGSEGSNDYWIVRNSWGGSWGEKGYIRIARDSTAPCGIDTTPADGTGCDGGPSTVKVCGECGILYDAVYPTVV